MGDAIQGPVPFQPTTTRAFAIMDTLRAFARVFGKMATNR